MFVERKILLAGPKKGEAFAIGCGDIGIINLIFSHNSSSFMTRELEKLVIVILINTKC